MLGIADLFERQEDLIDLFWGNADAGIFDRILQIADCRLRI